MDITMIEGKNDDGDDVVSSDRNESELIPLLTPTAVDSKGGSGRKRNIHRPSPPSSLLLMSPSREGSSSRRIIPRVTFTQENSISSPALEPKAVLTSWKTRKPLTRNEIIINQAILVLFTTGFMASVIGFVSLEEDGGGLRLFRLFYPTGSLMMMSIFLIRLEKYPKSVRSFKAKLAIFGTIQIPCIIILINVLYLNFIGSAFLIFITILLYGIQLILSFYYAFTCVSKLNY